MIAFVLVAELVVLLMILAVTQEEQIGPRYRRAKGCCQGCGYSLEGLPSEAPCPECGRPDPGAPERVVLRRVLSPRVCANAGLLVVLSALAGGSLAGVIGAAHRWSYALQLGRYDSSVIANAVRIREFDLPFADALVPLALSVLCCTLAVAGGERFPFKRFAWSSVGIGWLLSVCWLLISTYVRFG